MNFQQMFLKIKKKTDKAELNGFDGFLAIQINVTDLDCGGAFYVEHKDGRFSVEPYDYKDKTAEITCDYKTLIKLIDGKMELEKAIGSSGASMDGSWEHVKKVMEAFAENKLKQAVKKAKPVVEKTIKNAKPKVEKAIKAAEPKVKEAVKKVKMKTEDAVKKAEPKVKEVVKKTVKKIKK